MNILMHAINFCAAHSLYWLRLLLLPTCVSLHTPDSALWLNDLLSYFKIFMHFMTVLSACVFVHKSAPLHTTFRKEISLKQDNLSAGAGTDTTTSTSLSSSSFSRLESWTQTATFILILSWCFSITIIIIQINTFYNKFNNSCVCEMKL